jgi:hypothetical protein
VTVKRILVTLAVLGALAGGTAAATSAGAASAQPAIHATHLYG